MSRSSEKTQHDQIEVKNTKINRALHVIRQDRYTIDEEACYLEMNESRFKVANFSSFGIAIFSEIAFLEGAEFTEVQLVFDGVMVADNLHIKLVRTEKLPEEKYKLAFEILGEPIHVERILAVRTSRELLNAHNQRFKQLEALPEKALALIYQLKDWFEELQERVNSIKKNSEETDERRSVEFENTLIPMIGNYIGEEFPKHYRRLAEPLKGISPEDRKLLVELFRSKLSDLIHQSPFLHRVYHKPLGYAGDYEMMNLIYRSENVGSSLFARCLQYYSVREPAAQAVRNRADYLARKISHILEERKDENLQFLSVACGPSHEWLKIINHVGKFNQRKLSIDLLDQDKGALKYAQKCLKEASLARPNQFQFQFVHKAIKNLISQGIENKTYDVIYSAGLFDYLSDPVAQMAALKLYRSLNPGGYLIIGNFNVDNPNEVIMDLGLDWHLIYRSKKDLQSLFEHIGNILDIEYENLEINLFCVIRKE